jgi:peptidoglycan-associated lipoprotein
MLSRPVLTSCALVAVVLMCLFAGCAKEEEMPEAQATTVSSGSGTSSTGSMARPPAEDPSRRASEISRQAREEFQNRHIYFAFDRYDLSNEAIGTLDRKVAFLNDNREVRVQIEGHCDDRGTTAYNLALGERRANSAKTYLTTAGVSAARLSTVSYGEERPIDPGQTEAAWAKNRRAQFVLQN